MITSFVAIELVLELSDAPSYVCRIKSTLYVSNLNLNGLLVIRQIDNTSPGGCGRREISPWLSQEMRTWTHSHQTFQQRRSENQGGHSSP